MEHEADYQADTLATQTTEAPAQRHRFWLWALILVALCIIGVTLYFIYTANTGESLEDEYPLPAGFELV